MILAEETVEKGTVEKEEAECKETVLAGNKKTTCAFGGNRL